MNTSRNLIDLPLEVLGLIFQELPSLEDRLCLAEVHPHFELAFSSLYGQSFTNLNMTNRRILSALLPLCGSSVMHIENYITFDPNMLKFVEMHCPNLQSVNLFISGPNINSIKSFLANVRSLTSLNLSVESTLPNHLGILELLKFQPNLKSLCSNGRLSSGELLEVNNLVNLEKLKINDCCHGYFNLDKLCHRLNQLQTLEINTRVSTASEEFVGVPCPALKELHLFGTNQNWFSGIVSACQPAVLKWILSHAERLEILTLNINIMDHSREMIVYEILTKCKNLRYLSVPILYKEEADFVQRVVKIVTNNGVTSKDRPLQLKFNSRSIHDDFEKKIAKTPAELLFNIKNFI